MAAVIGHLGHGVLGCCDVFLLGKLASKHAPTNHGGRLPSHCLRILHAELVTLARPMIREVAVEGQKMK
jgi:hypothetical protein